MEQYLEKISFLQKELASRDEDIKLAATIGKGLLQGKKELEANVESLKQEYYSLKLSFDRKSQMVENQTAEIEAQKECCDALLRENSIIKKENDQLNKRIQEKLLEISDMQDSIEDQTTKKKALEQKISALEEQIRNMPSFCQPSLNETINEELLKLISRLEECQKERDELIALTSKLQIDLTESKNREEKLMVLIQEMQQELNDRDREIQANSSMLEKLKEENAELLATIEVGKLEQQADVNRRGNSLFSEVDDRRRMVEKEFLVLKKKYECTKENYQQKLEENLKLKNQFTMLLGMISKKEDSAYIEQLENNLQAARKEIDRLNMHNCGGEKFKQNLAVAATVPSEVSNDYQYMKALLEQSQKKTKELEAELQNIRVLKFSETEKLVTTQNLLYHSERKTDSFRAEVLKLKLKIQELTCPSTPGKVAIEKTEVIPGFEQNYVGKSIMHELNMGSNVKEFSTVKPVPSAEMPTKSEEKENCGHFQEQNFNKLQPSGQKKHVTFHSSLDSASDEPRLETLGIQRNKNNCKSAPEMNLNVGHGNCKQQ